MKRLHSFFRAACIFMALAAFPAGCKGDAEIVIEDDHTDTGMICKQEEQQDIYVYVAGRVANPDVYKVPSDYRIYQVIEMAGGFADDADISSLNLADKVWDGMKITVYAVGEETCGGEGAFDGQPKGLININTASKEQLMTLPGIGEQKAGSIISYREKNGQFKNIEDIMNIPGIKDGAFDKIKELITI